MNNEPVAYLMVERNDGNSYIQMGVPTRDEKISHQPYPLYTALKELNEVEILELWTKKNKLDGARGIIEFARAILKKASEK